MTGAVISAGTTLRASHAAGCTAQSTLANTSPLPVKSVSSLAQSDESELSSSGLPLTNLTRVARDAAITWATPLPSSG